ncbi:MAG: M48 family metallopeptidase [Pirellulaceae bacterium]
MIDKHAADADSSPSTESGGLDQGRGPDQVMSRDQLAESKAYGRRELQCTLFDMGVDLVYLGIMAFWGAMVIDQWLQDWPMMGDRWVRLATFYFIIMALHYAVSFPLSFYSGFVLEHRYKLSRQSFGRWLGRYVLRNVLTLLFGLIMVLGLFAIIWWTGPWWWLIAALATFAVTILLGQLLPVLILPLFYKVERLDDEQLRERLERLAAGTSLHIEGIFRMKLSSETVKANAVLAGLGRTRRVILGDTLLDRFTPEEIEVVFAHEIGHHVFHHITKIILLGLVYSMLGFYLCDQVLVGWVRASAGSWTYDYNAVPVHALPMILFTITLLSLILSPLRNALGRRFETACDHYALQLTGNVQAYRSAFSKLARLNKADPDPHPLEVFFMHDHPPVRARLALADQHG